MNSIEIANLKEFIHDSFSGGKMVRELRLTQDEARYIKEQYVAMEVEKMVDYREEEKQWYKLSIGMK
ncbi:hypothetical protein [Alkalihalobacillus sp. LMS39]|uniref:hypothetical protein n=1 Tax=Alkalihalobacillus sp. LMS39 TaxID=2924032 RepID=UPI001FB4AA2A|nr:hypothetical protein [Alkalihalobacillus sp. LMS39]UOE94046.1 hypothetical protein MM271_23205 [Alkalihalobacillus sp. LMS39]